MAGCAAVAEIMLRIGIDTGGTFTDFVVSEEGRLSVFKLPSTPDRPERALLEGLARIVGESGGGFLLQHGSTVATNALLERRGGRTLLLTTQGFEDLLEIGRQNRPALYSFTGSKPEPLVSYKHRLGVKERTLWDGSPLIPLENKSLDWLRNKVEQLDPDSIAVVLLYSYVNPEPEQRIAEALAPLGKSISLSHRIVPEFREYERASATVVNAYVAPVMSSYLKALASDPAVGRGRLTVMQSNGGAISAEAAAAEPVRTLFSGPAGGVSGAFEIARAAGFDRIVSFDMGGTSTDVCLCDGAISTTTEASIDGHPIPIQMIGIHTVGAGGGSVAWIDQGGLLRVGPRSVGADPGPACYGKGDEIAVTDANVFLGLLDPDWFLGGELPLAPERVRPALESLGQRLREATGRDWPPHELAEGVRRIVNTQMEGALRVISLEKGYDTRDFTLVSYGGSGGLHACDLARALLMPRVLVPANPGLLSALGILRADVAKDASLTLLWDAEGEDLAERVSEAFRPLEERVLGQLAEEGFEPSAVQLDRSIDARYSGQSYELNVPYGEAWMAAFHQKHEQFYGYSNPKLPVELVTVRVRGRASLPRPELPHFPVEGETPAGDALLQEKQLELGGRVVPTRFYPRNRLRPGNRIAGSAVILEYSSTTYVPEDFELRVDPWLNLVIEPK